MRDMGKKHEGDRAHDARRMRQQSAKGNSWAKRHPGYDAERMRRTRAERGCEPLYMNRPDINPLRVEADACIVAGDVHIPFYDADLFSKMLDVAQERGIDTFICPGDFWDCDNYSTWVNQKEGMVPFKETFRGEVEEVKMVLQILVDTFDHIYFTQGNHEFRWIAQNGGKMDIRMLFNLTGITEGYEVTSDDFLILTNGGMEWRLCHPQSFRQAPLSVVRDLAAKYQMNVIGAHGHQFTQGMDRSGKFICLDGGGLFDPDALGYLRRTSTHPKACSGFYVLEDGDYTPYKGRTASN
jgi:hypothetical protein